MNRKLLITFIGFVSLAFCKPLSAETVREVFQKATEALMAQDYQKAKGLYLKTIELNPKFSYAYNYLGLTEKELGSDASVVRGYFEKAITIDPNYVEAYNNLGKSYYGTGDFDKAQEYCEKALKINPGYVPAKLSLGWIYLLGKSKSGPAIKYFRDVVDQGGDLPYAYLGLGLAYFLENERPQVLESITALRNLKNEPFAQHLEAMLRSGHYAAPLVNGVPLISPQTQKGILISDISFDGTTFQDKSSKDTAKNIPVRLRTNGPTIQPSTESAPSNFTIRKSGRLKDLQQSSQAQGLNY